MRTVTLALFIHAHERKILLAMKKRGFGEGKWNGYGGKLLPGETPEDGAIREIQEESGITVEKKKLNHLGTIDFHFLDAPDWDQRGIIYRIDEWEGEPVETEEMSPRWFSFDDIPYGEMWIDDFHWFPHLLVGEKFTAMFEFEEKGAKISKQIVSVVP